MPVKKTYDLAATKAAIDRSNYTHINSLKMVRSDVSVHDWGRKHIPVAQRNPDVPADLQFPGQKDVGHVFRHVEGTEEVGKSIYQDETTAIEVTCELLNSTEGQAALGVLDGATAALYDNTTQRVTADLAPKWFGRPGAGGPLKQIKSARCEIMKLGDDILWVHSSYPYKFV